MEINAGTAILTLPETAHLACPPGAQKNPAWLTAQGITVPSDCVYLAPRYGPVIEDCALVEQIRQTGIRHVVVTIGGGTQERLGFYLKEQLNYLAGVYCIGAAIAFLSGDQVYIPQWADRFYLGWLFRCISSPRRYVPRYWSAWQLVPLLWRFRSQLPTPSAEFIHSDGPS